MIYVVIIIFTITISLLLFYLLIYRNKYKDLKLLDQDIATGITYYSSNIYTRDWQDLTIYGYIESNNIGATIVSLETSNNNQNWIVIDNNLPTVVNGNKTTFYLPEINPDIGFMRLRIESQVNSKIKFYAVLKDK